MRRLNKSVSNPLPEILIPAIILFYLTLSAASASAAPLSRFDRTYTPHGAARLTISNINGLIHVSAWDKRTISVHGNIGPAVEVTEGGGGDDIIIAVKTANRGYRIGRADFEINVPADTVLTLKNLMGDIEVRNISGPISIGSIDSNVRLLGVNSSAVDVKVTSGDIIFDGDLQDGGNYSMQSLKGDLDVTVPESTPFSLNARALSENINLGSFLSNLIGSAKGPKGFSGSYLKGGPRLTLTAYAGRILLHKK